MKSPPGRKRAIASLVCAVLALVIAPVVFGPLGVLAGTVAGVDGEQWGAPQESLPAVGR